MHQISGGLQEFLLLLFFSWLLQQKPSLQLMTQMNQSSCFTDRNRWQNRQMSPSFPCCGSNVAQDDLCELTVLKPWWHTNGLQTVYRRSIVCSRSFCFWQKVHYRKNCFFLVIKVNTRNEHCCLCRDLKDQWERVAQLDPQGHLVPKDQVDSPFKALL